MGLHVERSGRRRTSTRQLWAKSIVSLGITLAVVSGGPSGSRLGAGGAQQPPADLGISPAALAQINALAREKASRTGPQRKMDSRLLYAVKMARGEQIAAGVPTLDLALQNADSGALTIDISTTSVSDLVYEQLRAIGADVLSTAPAPRTLRIAATLAQIESIAALPEVTFVQPKQEAITSAYRASARGRSSAPVERERARTRRRFNREAFRAAIRAAAAAQSGVITNTGSVTSQGDVTHRAAYARATYFADGSGIKVGVLSDGVTSLAASQASGDLGPVTVLPGQTGTGDEGTAMLEIVHDLAPGAQLYFATAFGGIASFAQNIRDLRSAGCDIIVDDVFYFIETPFQDGQTPSVVSTTNGGVVIQAVKDVVAGGALYFSSAGNSGNFDSGTSGTWEGNFVDNGSGLHNFGGGQTYDVLTDISGPINLYWSDPLGGATDDYDLYRLNSTGTAVLSASTNIQNGTQDPYEEVTGGTTGDRIVVVKSAGSARFLHLDTNRGRLSIATAGQIHGHAATSGLSSFGIAATPASVAYPNPFNSSDVVETFSSDGPRRYFFNADSSAVTPGNFSSTGGAVLNKPDITAADGVSVTGAGGFATLFYGTSAAAPHAAAIAALVKSAHPSLTAAQVRTALVNSAIDIQAAGLDRDSGYGIVMADTAVQSVLTNNAILVVTTATGAEHPGNGNGAINAGEGAQLTVALKNIGTAAATAISATLTTPTPGVIVTLPATSSYPDIGPGGTSTNTTAFNFTLSSNVPCPLTVDFTLTVAFSGGASSPVALALQLQTGPPPYTITTTLDTTAPPSSPGVTTSTGTQTGRITRNGVKSSCAAPKAFPGLFDSGSNRRYDLFSFATCPESTATCASVSLLAGSLALFSAAYTPSFNPANVQESYAADAGISTNAAGYSFSVGGGVQHFAVDVHEVDATGGLGTQYTLSVAGVCAGACATPNRLPVAVVHDVVVLAGPGGSAYASIDNGSYDPDGDPITITQVPPGPYPIGTTSVRLTVVDRMGATVQASANVTVTANPNPVKDLVAGVRSSFTLADSTSAAWAAIEAVEGRSYCGQIAPGRGAVDQANPTLTVYHADAATVIGTASGTPRVCFVASTTETVFIKVSQSDTGGRIYLLDAVETTLWANWFYIGASYSSFTLLRNTTGSAVDATITWRADSGTVVGSVSVAVPAYGVVFYDARFMTSGVRSGAGSVEVAHNGEPQAIVASQTTLSAATGLSFDTLFFQRNRR